jgi:hypothetical protein
MQKTAGIHPILGMVNEAQRNIELWREIINETYIQ